MKTAIRFSLLALLLLWAFVSCTGPQVIRPGFLLQPAKIDPLKVASDIDPGPSTLLISRAPEPLYPKLGLYGLQLGVLTLADITSQTSDSKDIESFVSPLLHALNLENKETGENPAVLAPIWSKENAAEFEETYFKLARIDPGSNVFFNNDSSLSSVLKAGAMMMANVTMTAAVADASLFFEEVPALARKLFLSAAAFRLRTGELAMLPGVYQRIGQVSISLGNYQDAVVLFEEAIRLKNDNTEVADWLLVIEALEHALLADEAGHAIAYIKSQFSENMLDDVQNKKLAKLQENLESIRSLVSRTDKSSLAYRLDLAEMRLTMGLLHEAQKLARELRKEAPDDARPVLLEAHIAWKRNRTREAAGLIAEARGLKHLPQNYFRMAGISWAIRWEANMQANFSQVIKQNYTPIWPEALEDEWHAVVAPLTRQYDQDRARLFEVSRKFGEVCYEKAGTKHNLSRLFPDIEALYQKHRYEEEYAFLVPTAALTYELAFDSFPLLAEIASRQDIDPDIRFEAVKSMISVSVRLGRPWLLEDHLSLQATLPANDLRTSALTGNIWALVAQSNHDPGYWRNAILAYRAATTDASSPQYRAALNNLAVALVSVGRESEAAPLFAANFKKHPHDAGLKLNQAILSAKAGNENGFATLLELVLNNKLKTDIRYLAATWYAKLSENRRLSGEVATAFENAVQKLVSKHIEEKRLALGQSIQEVCRWSSSLSGLDKGYFLYHVTHDLYLTYPSALSRTKLLSIARKIAVASSF